MPHYNSYRAYLKNRFGKPVLKIPVNAGFSCPNRDGTKSGSGCSFCDNRSFSPVALNVSSTLDQIDDAMQKARGKFDAFIVYLQPFSNTYGSAAELAEIYGPVINIPGVVGLAVGTRPDCFSNEIYDYLWDVSKRTYLSVEIGLQSAHDETLALCNRHHTLEDFRGSVKELSARGIETVAHVVLGLPRETATMMMETAQELARLPVTGVKIHQLMIVRGTLLEQWHTEGEITCLTIEEYAQLLCDFLSYLRPDQHIHRIVADSTADNGLVAPPWSADKMKTVALLQTFMDKNATTQGSRRRVQRS